MVSATTRARRWTGLWLGLWAGGCGNDPRKVCTPQNPGDVVAVVMLRGKDAEDEPLYECVDLHLASRIDAAVDSPGLNESFATSRPDVIPWTRVTYDDAAFACGRAGKFLCSSNTLRALVPFSSDPRASVSPPVAALSPTSAATDYPEQDKPLWASQRATPEFPDVVGGIPVWTGDGEILGRVQSALVEVTAEATPIHDPAFEHPLVGFRCCIDARIETAFEPFAEDPQFIRSEPVEVPIASP